MNISQTVDRIISLSKLMRHSNGGFYRGMYCRDVLKNSLSKSNLLILF